MASTIRYSQVHDEGNTFRPVAYIEQSDSSAVVEADFPGSGNVILLRVYDLSGSTPGTSVYDDDIAFGDVGTYIKDTVVTTGFAQSAGIPRYNLIAPIVPKYDSGGALILLGGRSYEVVVILVAADNDAEDIQLVWSIPNVTGHYYETS